MSVTQTSGLFPVAQLPAAQVVSVHVFLANLENQPATAIVQVSKLVGNNKQRVLHEQVDVPGDERRILSLGSDVVEGETLEVTVTLPTNGFVPPQSGIAPSVSVVTTFIGDNSTSLLQLISARDFVSVPTH